MATALLQLGLIIALCSVCGWLAERLGQCRVVGEIVAGLLLGPSVLGYLSPGAYDTLFAETAARGITQIGDIGLVLLMFQIGLHLKFSAGNGLQAMRAPIVVSALGMALPAAAGIGIAVLSKSALAPDSPEVPYALFCGIALAVSAVPVMARIIDDMGLSASPTAGLAMSSAIVTDAAGWLVLAMIASASVSGGPTSTCMRNLCGLLVYLATGALAARYIVRPLLGRCEGSNQFPAYSLTVVICYIMASAWVTSMLGFHTAFGALAAALSLQNVPRLTEQWERQVMGFVRLVLTPVFFACAGLHASLGTLNGTSAWAWFSIFLLGGFSGKFGGVYLGARLTGRIHREALLAASLLSTRGLMELIVLSIGLELHILPQRVYTILVMFALVTTAMIVPLVRLVTLHGLEPRQTVSSKPGPLPDHR